jgi:uncharacterized protein
MDYLWAAGLAIVNLVWLAAALLALPGNWLIVISTALVAWLRPGMFSPITLIAIVVLAVVGETVELLSSLVGARYARATRWGALGAMVGGMIGAVAGTFLIPIPVVGSLLGAGGGACVGAMAADRAAGRNARRAVHAGLAAGVGRILGAAFKLGIGAILWVVVTIASFWP